ncbi:beta-lactamase/transpeptidase-like protein [Mycena sanguinolenta]|nr:beta-lactamase/transpeptidase-like protein [Mycena sanguinolenta]
MLILTSTLALLTFPVSTRALTSQIPLQYSRNEGKVINEGLASFIQTELQANNFTGLSLAVVLPSGEVEFAAWGIRTEQGDPVNSETVMNIGSCSKAFLSASLGILMQDFADGNNKSALPNNVDKFNWDTKMRDLLPDEWMTEDPWTTEKASLKDLFSHVTGLPAHDVSYSPYDSSQDIVARMRHLRSAYELRQFYEYNNQMYITGAYVVSKYAGSSYRDFVEERIIRPLRMSSSTLYPNRAFETGKFTVLDAISTKNSFFYARTYRGLDCRCRRRHVECGGYGQLEANKGSALTSIGGYGLGWGRMSYRGHEVVQHNGGAPGVASVVDLYPSDGFGIVLLANTAGPLVTQTIARAVADRVLGLPIEASRIKTEMCPSTQPQIPVNAIPSDMLAGFTGTYSNLGYGNFTLCSPLFPSSADCLAIIQDFRRVDSAAGKHIDPLGLYSAWPRFLGSHLRLSQVSGYDYAVKLVTLYVDGYGVDRTPFEDVLFERSYPAKFMVEDRAVIGLGLFVAGQESWRAKKGGSVREIADVWFNKL